MLTNFNRKKSESVTRFSNFIPNPGDMHTSLIQISSHSIHYGKWNSRQGKGKNLQSLSSVLYLRISNYLEWPSEQNLILKEVGN